MRLCLSLIVLLLVLAVPGFAQETEKTEAEPTKRLTYGLETDFFTRYVFRGIAFSEGAVQQTQAWVSANNFTLTVWSNFVLEKGPLKGRFDEVDLIFGYAYEGQGFTFEPYLTLYLATHGNFDNTGELTLNFSKPVGPVSVFTNQNFDVQLTPGAYFGDVGVLYERELGQGTLETAASIGWADSRWNNAYFGVSRSALNVWEGKLAWTYNAAGYYLRPHVGLTSILDKRLREAVEDRTIFTAGLAIGAEF